MTSQNRITAVHESGHSLAAHLAGLTVSRAFIGADPLGEVSEDDALGGVALILEDDTDWRRLLLTTVAGWAAETLCFPGIEADRGHDEGACLAMLQDAGFARHQAAELIDRASLAMVGLLSQHRPALEAVADWLERNGDIDGETVAAIVTA